MSDTRYTETHEWARKDGDLIVIGITRHAAEELGDVVFAEPPEVGKTLTRGDECAVVESVKAASDIYAPVSGEVVDANDKLSDAPETVNEDPMGEGWFAKIKPTDPSEFDKLLDEAAYKDHIKDS